MLYRKISGEIGDNNSEIKEEVYLIFLGITDSEENLVDTNRNMYHALVKLKKLCQKKGRDEIHIACQTKGNHETTRKTIEYDFYGYEGRIIIHNSIKGKKK